jgi:hypothetical protein
MLDLFKIDYNNSSHINIMSFTCRYLCGSKFTAKCSCQRHENNSCKLRPENTSDGAEELQTIKPKCKIKLRSVAILDQSEPFGILEGGAGSEQTVHKLLDMNQALISTNQSLIERLNALEARLEKQQQNDKPNITVNNVNNVSNTVVYNCFDYKMIDIFKILLDKYGSDKAISFSSKLLRGKTKENKHDWVTNPELGLDMASLSKVLSLSYESGEKDPCFNLLNAEQKVITDRDGSMLDKILTDTVVDAGLKAQSYVAKEATEAGDAGDKVGMWDNWSNSSIYNSQNHETIHDDIFRYQKILPTKKHLINVVRNVRNSI